MRQEEEQFLSESLDRFHYLADKKYRRGVKQHGGYLWKKPDLLDQTESEIIDCWHYIQGFRKMIEDLGIKLGDLKYKDKDSVDNFIKLPENEVVNKLSTNLACPHCNKPITDKDLKHFKCTKCKKSFRVNFNENI